MGRDITASTSWRRPCEPLAITGTGVAGGAQTGQVGAVAESTGSDGAASDGLAFRLLVQDGDPLSGRLAVEGRVEETTFSGWIELMAAVNAAREAAGRESGAAPD